MKMHNFHILKLCVIVTRISVASTTEREAKAESRERKKKKKTMKLIFIN